MYTNLADAICDHIGCAAMGDSLPSLARALGITLEALTPTPPKNPHIVRLPDRGISLVLRHLDAGEVEVGDPGRWLITDVLFDAVWPSPLPFGLDAQGETQATAQKKLGFDTTGLSQAAVNRGDRRQSFTLDDARVVELFWKPSLVGIDRVWVVRLGAHLDAPPAPRQARA
jgi:hypothetical protein